MGTWRGDLACARRPRYPTGHLELHHRREAIVDLPGGRHRAPAASTGVLDAAEPDQRLTPTRDRGPTGRGSGCHRVRHGVRSGGRAARVLRVGGAALGEMTGTIRLPGTGPAAHTERATP